MHVVVASRNPAKLRAVDRAFREQFPGVALTVDGVSVPSGVRDQPVTDEETRRGAHNRTRAASEARPDADYWVGLEGGLERIDGAWFASAWMVVRAADGRRGEARTPTLPLPPGVQALLDEGLELGEANDRVFGTKGSKQAGGAFGLLTEGRLTRSGVYAQTIGLALLPLTHALWATAATGET
jgi:inosine/xanthosine triphosphatase